MDVKMGTRTFLEEEAAATKLRVDLATKLHEIDPALLLPGERERGITKGRYLQQRDSQSSSATSAHVPWPEGWNSFSFRS